MKIVTISEELAAFRAGHPGCLVVAFADFSTGMVLASDTAERTTHEKLDALCDAGAACLDDARTLHFADAFAGLACRRPQQVWLVDAHGLKGFFRLEAPASEALCLAVDRAADVGVLGAQALRLLQRIAAEG